MAGYTATLSKGQEIFIPFWAASVALENLSKAGKFIGSDNLLRIAELNIPSVMLAIMEAEDSAATAGLIKHFICTVRMDEQKIDPSQYDSKFENELYLTAELFAHVVKAQYADFFVLGLAKANSPKD